MKNNIVWLKNLQTIRKSRNITQLKLSVDLAVSQELISQYELGKSMPNSAMLSNLANYFNCSTDYLLGRTNVETPIKSLIDENNIKNVELINKYNSLTAENKRIFDSFLEFLTVHKSE